MKEPKYTYGDVVSFNITDVDGVKTTKTGEILIVDRYGTWENDSEPSYDIMVKDTKHFVAGIDGPEQTVGDCLYKHISESLIL